MKILSKSALLAVALFMLIDLSLAQKPRVTNAQIQELPGADLKATVNSIVARQTSAAWIGYRIPVEAKEHTMCCFDSLDQFRSAGSKCCMGCRMDSEKGGSFSGTVTDCTPPEPVPYAFLFLRVADKQIGRVRVFSADCPLDFAGLPLTWLEDVKPEQSVELLTSLATSGDPVNASGKKSSSHNAIMAIAMHDTPAADSALEKLIQPGQ